MVALKINLYGKMTFLEKTTVAKHSFLCSTNIRKYYKGGLYYMKNITISVPEEIFLNLHESQSSFNDYAKKVSAIDLYKNKKLSLGYCSSVADMSKEDFIHYLSNNGVSIFSFEDEKEFLEELDNA